MPYPIFAREYQLKKIKYLPAENIHESPKATCMLYITGTVKNRFENTRALIDSRILDIIGSDTVLIIQSRLNRLIKLWLSIITNSML
jgi:hypothetical protein